MTDNLPAVPTPERTEREVATTDTDSWIQVVGEVAKLAQYVADTEFVPKSLRGNPAAVTAAVMYGREVGLPPMTSLTQTHVIEGRPSISAAAQRALVLAAGHDVETLESTGAICRMRARRRGAERWTSEVVWTLDMARAAGLLSKSNWKNYPRAMLLARCSAELCAREFPDVVLGFSSIEEIEDMGGEERDAATSAEVAGTTKVSRRTTRKSAPPAAIPPAAARPSTTPDGPPLPGEDGTPDVVPDQTSAASDDVAPASHAAGDGKDREDAADVADPEAEVVVEDVPVEGPPAPVEAPAAEGAPAPTRGGAKSSQPQRSMIFATLGELGVDDVREERLLIASKIVNRPIDSFTDLSKSEASHMIDTLAQMKDKAELWALLDAIDEAAVEGQS